MLTASNQPFAENEIAFNSPPAIEKENIMSIFRIKMDFFQLIRKIPSQ